MEHWIEALVGLIAVCAAALAAWIDLNGRVRVLERIMQDHLAEKNAIMADLTARLTRLEEKIDTVALRCAAFLPLHERRQGERRHDPLPLPQGIALVPEEPR